MHAIRDWSPRDFFELIEWFGQRWSVEFPAFAVWTCKWRPEDLIPGLSDLDARVICEDIGPADWVRLDELAAQTQLEVLLSRPEWARKLEHTPGVCSTKSEVLDPAVFQPEMRTWDYYWGDREVFNQIREFVHRRSWEPVDEYYFLAQRFLPWCTPYNRSIDPPINIPAQILPKYALHSRVMHYFVPCIMAALPVITRDTVTGKREALYRWSQRYPSEPVLHEAIHLLDVNYEVPWLEEEQEWHAFEERLWQFIQKITPEVLRAVTIVDLGDDLSLGNLKRQLSSLPGEPMMTLYNGVRFSRIRKGRWVFYLSAPDWFDSGHVCQWEIRWLASTFTRSLFDSYSQLKWGQKGLPLDELLAHMPPAVADENDKRIVRQVFAAGSGQPTPAEARERLRQAAEVYSDYYLLLERMLADARQGAGRP